MPEPGCSLCLAVSMSAHCQPWKGPGFGMAEERGWEGPFDPKSLRAVGAVWLLLAGDPSFTFYFPFPCVKRAFFCIPWAGLGWAGVGGRAGDAEQPQSSLGSLSRSPAQAPAFPVPLPCSQRSCAGTARPEEPSVPRSLCCARGLQAAPLGPPAPAHPSVSEREGSQGPSRSFPVGQSELSLSAVRSLVAIETTGIYRHHTAPSAASPRERQCQGPHTCPSPRGGTGLSPRSAGLLGSHTWDSSSSRGNSAALGGMGCAPSWS